MHSHHAGSFLRYSAPCWCPSPGAYSSWCFVSQFQSVLSNSQTHTSAANTQLVYRCSSGTRCIRRPRKRRGTRHGAPCAGTSVGQSAASAAGANPTAAARKRARSFLSEGGSMVDGSAGSRESGVGGRGSGRGSRQRAHNNGQRLGFHL